ncbi:MAG: hypothetical protein JWO68_1593 [Actinomycetia bacterium]|nr:hypothetical protein [Actinomycetes bacterium]
MRFGVFQVAKASMRRFAGEVVSELGVVEA